VARARNLRASFLIGSLVLHALLLGVAATRRSTPPRVLPHRVERATEIELDFAPEAEAPPPEAPATSTPEQLASPAPRHPPTGRPVLSQLEPSPSADEAPSTAGAEDIAATDPASAAPATSAAPGLSLAQLGVEGPNQFLDRGDPAAARAAKARAVKRRLDRALAQGLTDADVERGHGVHGPVLRSLEAAVYASNVPLNARASFVFVIDGSGKLVSTTLGDATGDRSAWLRAARQTLQSLGKLPVKNGKGVRLIVAVKSHLELPSGADPGLEISMQGVPIKKGDGPRSTRLDLSIFPFPAAGLMGDPADIGARPRRMVHSHVVSEELL
jgi:hypothetical protein